MKKTIMLVGFVVLMGIILFSTTGCQLIDNLGKGAGKLGEEINNGYENNKENNVDSNGLTKNLIGNKIKDDKSYFKGDYEATYTDFNGKEFVFGGMKVDKEDLTNLKITYSIQKESGTIFMYLLDEGDRIEILSDDLNGIYEFDGSPNKFVVIEGKDFKGKVNLSIK